jgi:hypothetical protein
MVSQEELSQGEFAEYNLYEAPEHGQLHSLPTEEERRMIVDRGKSSDYMIQVRLVSCVHGTLDEVAKKPASLIIFEYRIKSFQEGRAFSSVRTSFTFTESKDSNVVPRGYVPGHGPKVKAFAPFRDPAQFNETFADLMKKGGLKGTIGTGSALPVKVEVGGDGSSSAAWKQRYFDEGTAGLRHDDLRHVDNGVEWYIHHNERQNHGVSPLFRLAVLIEREEDELFYGTFSVRVDGGKIWALQERFRHLISAPGHPIIFNPGREPMWNEDAFDAEEVGKLGVERTRLGALAKGKKLDALSHVWGLTPLQKHQEG